MKKISSITMGWCGALVLGLTGCATEHRDRRPEVVLAAPPPPDMVYAQPEPGRSRFWYRVHHRMFSDGYSFNYDPYNHDSLAPTLGLDQAFPPAPQPYKDID